MIPEVLYLDNHLLALNKPAGWVTHEDGVHTETLRLWAQNYLVERFQKKGAAFVVPVHRLDLGSSGVVLFAKTEKALKRLTEAFREREVSKRYRVCVEGLLREEENFFEDTLLRKGSKSSTVEVGRKGGQKASLHYQRLRQERNYAECLVDLQTGRHHQIRVQFASRGHCVLGDRKYGSRFDFSNKWMLHHERLEISHPVTKEKIVFEAPLPDFWLRKDLFPERSF